MILEKYGENISVKHSTNSLDFGLKKDSTVKKWISGSFLEYLSVLHTSFVYFIHCTQFIQKMARFYRVEKIFENILYSISVFCLKYFIKSSTFWTFLLLVKYFSCYFLLWWEASCAWYIELTWCKPLPYYWIFTFSFEWARTFFLQLHSVQHKLHFPINFHSIFFYHSSPFTWFFCNF